MSEDLSPKTTIFRKNWDLMKARHKRMRKLRGLDKGNCRVCSPKACNANINNINALAQIGFLQAFINATMLEMMDNDMFF